MDDSAQKLQRKRTYKYINVGRNTLSVKFD